MLEAFQGRQGLLRQLADCVHQRLQRLLEAGLWQNAF